MKLLAQFDIVFPKYPATDERMNGFYHAAPHINALAEAQPGFIWRLKEETKADFETLAEFGNDILFTLSVWKDVDALKNFLFKTEHVHYMKRGKEWFHRIDQAKTVLWWISDDHRPNVQEAKLKLNLLREQGPTSSAFTLHSDFK